MRDYGRIHCAYWTSADIQPLSDAAKLLGAYLLTCQHGTIAGAFRLPVGYVADDLKWSFETVTEGFNELSRIGFINRCATSNWVWLRKYLTWNSPENPNQWKAIRKIAAQIPANTSWLPDFVGFLAHFSGEKQTETRNPSETVGQTVSKSVLGTGVVIGAGERDAPARDDAGAPRETGIIPADNRLTTISAASAFGSLLEDWRRDAPETNPDAFAKWIIHVEASGKQMTPGMRLAQARRLAGNGDFAAQAEVVLFCMENGFKTLIPVADVRARTQGMARAGGTKAKIPAPTEADRLQKLMDRRAGARHLQNFRDPQPGETADQYLRAQDDEWKRFELEEGRRPRFPEVRDLVKGIAESKRISA